jgi:hypothetical protein
MQYPMYGNVFKSGGFDSHSHQNGPGEMNLAFSPQGSQIVSGEGTNSIGARAIEGYYPPSTGGMNLQKQY